MPFVRDGAAGDKTFQRSLRDTENCDLPASGAFLRAAKSQFARRERDASACILRARDLAALGGLMTAISQI